MKRATFNVLFYVKRSKPLRDGTLPIFARITINNKRAEFGLQRNILNEQWDPVKGRALSASKENKELNAYLETVKVNLHMKKRELDEKGQPYTASQLKDAYYGIDRQQRTLLEIYREHNEKCQQLKNLDYAPGTVSRYETGYKLVSIFMKLKYKKNDIPVQEVTPMFISDFEVYLKATRGCSHNTATKYIKNFKKIIRIALANGWLKVDPFANIKFHLDDVDMAYLDEKELNVLMNKKFEIKRMEQVKDIYLFCCFTGLAFVDVKSLRYTDIEDKDGNLWIKKKRQKTKNLCTIPMLKPAIDIMEMYKEHPYCLANGCVLPVLSNQKMNAYLKEIADLCGIKKNLSTHTARHTFATTVTLANQVSMEVVSKMLGHSSVNMTKKYARVVDDLISRDMQKIVGKYGATTVN
jgi:site-specific recombinase XerD